MKKVILFTVLATIGVCLNSFNSKALNYSFYSVAKLNSNNTVTSSNLSYIENCVIHDGVTIESYSINVNNSIIPTLEENKIYEQINKIDSQIKSINTSEELTLSYDNSDNNIKTNYPDIIEYEPVKEKKKNKPKQNLNEVGNDGTIKKNPYGDSGADITYNNAEYYDFLIPYKCTLSDIGGYAVNVGYSTDEYNGRMVLYDDSEVKNQYLGGSRFNLQGTKSSDWLIGGVQTEEETGLQYVSKNDCNYYIASLGKCVFNTDSVEKGLFPAWCDVQGKGILYDMILLDGTVIHFVLPDGIGLNHTNNDSSDIVASDSAGVLFTFSDLKEPQYKNLFHASSPSQIFEFFYGDYSKEPLKRFTEKYNIDSIENPIVAIRLWSKTIWDDLDTNKNCGGFSFSGKKIKTRYENNKQFVKTKTLFER